MWEMFFKHPYYLLKDVDGDEYKFGQVVVHNNKDTLAEVGILFNDTEIFPKLSKRHVHFWRSRPEDESEKERNEAKKAFAELSDEDREKELDEWDEKHTEREKSLYTEITKFISSEATSLLVQCNNLAENRSGMMIDKMKWIWLIKDEERKDPGDGWIPATGDEAKDPDIETAIGLWIDSISKDVEIKRSRELMPILPQFIMMPNSKVVYLSTRNTDGSLAIGGEVEHCPFFMEKVAAAL